MSSKISEKKGPWHHAAVAALQGASIEEQLQHLDPDLVQHDEIYQGDSGPGLGFGALNAPPPTMAPARAEALVVQRSDRGAHMWGRWDVHTRGRTVPSPAAAPATRTR